MRGNSRATPQANSVEPVSLRSNGGPAGFVHVQQQRLSTGSGSGWSSAGSWMLTRSDGSAVSLRWMDEGARWTAANWSALRVLAPYARHPSASRAPAADRCSRRGPAVRPSRPPDGRTGVSANGIGRPAPGDHSGRTRPYGGGCVPPGGPGGIMAHLLRPSPPPGPLIQSLAGGIAW